ncbi:MAG TPA: alpha/beta hydrolase, partial [Ktedonobacterales bacterium]|nr:alpha/beta hydrolase [Ktedonobacterales bacterium]
MNQGTPTIAARGVVVQGQRLATAMNDAPHDLMPRPPLVLLPAAGFVWQDYLAVLERFASERRVFALDWPGFGGSDRPPPHEFDYSGVGFAEALSGWLDGLGIARSVLLGNGIGATAALRYAADHPQRVLGLVLVSPLGFGTAGRISRLAARALSSPALLRRIEPALTSLALGPHTPTTAVVAERLKATRATAENVLSLTASAALWRNLDRENREMPDVAKRVEAPAIVIRGALDPIVSAANSRQATALIGPHGALEVVLPDAGYLPFLQQPGPFFRAVAGILNTAE